MLQDFLVANTDEIIARTREKVAMRSSNVPQEKDLGHGVPLFLNQLIDLLGRASNESGDMKESAAVHGGELLVMGFTVSQVVHAYGDVCQAVTELAVEKKAPITAAEFHTFNRCLDDAIANAVTEYERKRDASVTRDGAEKLGILAHELRNRLSAAFLAYEILLDGKVAIRGSTGAVLGRNLRAMRELISNSLSSVRMDAGITLLSRTSVAEVISEAEVEARMSAEVEGIRLTVTPFPVGIDVNVDQHLLSAALGNLIQNAFKFGLPKSQVILRTTATAEKVLIEVEDQCGGLAPGRAEEMFEPFAQRTASRAGLGLGLSISRKGIETMGGTLTVRNLPLRGCVFSVELPRLPAS